MIRWIMDADNSEVTFRVKHLMISTVSGRFENISFTGFSETNDFYNVHKLEFVADAASISTGVPERDEHLRSADFFDVEKYPSIYFQAEHFEVDNDEPLKGHLTIKGITRPIELEVTYNGMVIDAHEQTKVGFSVKGKINRKDYDLKWNQMTEAGGVVVSDEIRIYGEIELVRAIDE